MKPTIYLALTHDWELRGDGSGDIDRIQFAPLRRLLEIYQRAGACTTFMPDVMQQIAFRNLEPAHPELKSPADSWDEHVLAARQKGHDIQLHLHSQWSDASYQDGVWDLRGSWSLLAYDAAAARRMITRAKEYLEGLLHPVDKRYRCVAFRASALALAPSATLLPTLAELGIEVDVSMAAGFHLDNETLQVDYRTCKEGFLPYFPQMDDAREVSKRREPIVCVPLNHFYGSRRAVTRQNLLLARDRLQRSETAKPALRAQLDTQTSGLARVYEKLIVPMISRKYFVSDTGRLNYELMREMLASIRKRAGSTGLAKVPIVLTNHPKDIRDWDGLERFVAELAEADDIKFITLSELAEKLRAGEFTVRIGE
jgi:hypothetical protein